MVAFNNLVVAPAYGLISHTLGMAKTPEKQAFSERLKQALKRSPKRIETPTELATQFNLNYAGKSVTNQAVQKWFSGENRPAPDKIETLAQMLNVSYTWLRYGITDVRSTKSGKSRPEASDEIIPTPEELQWIRQYRRLSAHQQGLINDLVEQLIWSADQ